MARRAKKASREKSHKPHIHLYVQGTFRCFSHNATGRGETPRAAFLDWKHAQHRYEQYVAQREFFGRLST